MRPYFFGFLFAALVLLSCSQNESSIDDKEHPFTIEQKNVKNFESSKFSKKKVDSLFVELSAVLDTIVMSSQVYYLVEGDLVLDAAELYDYCYERIYSQMYDTGTFFQKQRIEEFTISVIDSQPEVWAAGKTLTYAVLRNTFGDKALYDSAVKLMNEAAGSWMRVANIKFEHLTSYDTLSPRTDPADPVVFYVQAYTSNSNFIAKAFFPSDLAFKRKILLQPVFFSPTLTVSKAGILRHELGHVLGARHEHIWSKVRECNRGEGIVDRFRSARPLTAYDPYSVMHYLCENGGTTTLELTDFDIHGIQTIYGKR